jgi:hypothetical protein
MTTNKKQADLSRRRLLTGPRLASAYTGMCSDPGSVSFRRIVDIPFEACVAALEGWRLQGHNSEPHVSQSRLCGPDEHDRGPGTCRVEVRLARRPLRPLLRMRLDVDYWSSSPPGSALEFIPCGRVRATPSYFRPGHLLLDSLTRSLQLERQIQPPDPPAGQPSDPARARRVLPTYLSQPRCTGRSANFQRAASTASPGQRGADLAATAPNWTI